MEYTLQEHYLFLKEELRAETDAFQQKLETKALYLLEEREELFIAQFMKFENGEMILKFSNKRGLPRKGEYLYCFLTPNRLHNYEEWGNNTYGDLIKARSYSTEVVCIWQSSLRDNPDYCLVGFRGVDIEFAEHIDGHAGAFLVLGPNVPPYQYIKNLQDIVRRNNNESIANLLEGEIDEKADEAIQNISPTIDVAEFMLTQLSLCDFVLLQGPPGTGKTTQIAKICKHLCMQNQSVLVTALTNRALMEVAGKEELTEILSEGKIHKTKLSVDESKELPALHNMKNLSPEPGQIVLSTFYITSGEASNILPRAIGDAPFDVVIMDEASQALLSMFAGVKLLGKKCIFVGDTNQLPPVVVLNSDRIARRNYHCYADGLATMSRIGNIPAFRMTQTYRLPPRAAQFTGLFYNGSLISKAKVLSSYAYPDMREPYGKFFHPQGGPSLIKMDLPLGDKRPMPAMALATMLVAAVLEQNPKQKVAALSFYVETTKALQKAIFQTIGSHNNLLVETVSRIQGLTTDVVIYVVPNTIYTHTLNRQLFNVATSRATRHTIIIVDKGYRDHAQFIDNDVLRFLNSIDDVSYYIPIHVNASTLAIDAPCEVIQEEPTRQEIASQAEPPMQVIGAQTIKKQEDNFIPTEAPKIGVKVVGKIDLSKFETPKRQKKEKDGCYIIDTNVFVQCPDILYKIGKNYSIVLSIKVIDELDKLKVQLEKNEDKEAVKKALFIINKLVDTRGIALDVADMRLLPREFDRKSPDNMILAVALNHIEDNPILLTSDNGLQIKAKGLGLKAQSLKTFLSK